jgi:hypothetical protein
MGAARLLAEPGRWTSPRGGLPAAPPLAVFFNETR